MKWVTGLCSLTHSPLLLPMLETPSAPTFQQRHNGKITRLQDKAWMKHKKKESQVPDLGSRGIRHRIHVPLHT